MKNAIKYYYNLDVDSIRQIDTTYYLLINNVNYILCECDLVELEKIEKYLYNNYKFHNLILTFDKKLGIIYNNKNYCLFKINTIFRKISLDDILNSNLLISSDGSSLIDRWIELWSVHIDYIENQMQEMNTNYNYLKRVINYYIGLAETAVQFLKSINKQSIPLYLVHKRVRYTTNLVDLYNPSFLVIDTRIRDIAEYFKDIFFFKDDLESNIISNIKMLLPNYTNIEKQLFFARMIYPTYFFDKYEEIIQFHKNEKILDTIISKSDKYEKLLNAIFIEIKKTTYIQNIDWLII